MKKSILIASTAILTLILTGCPNNSLLQNNLNSSNQHIGKPLIFKTNTSTFINRLHTKSNKMERNSYINEYILKSDIQCRNYLQNSDLKPIQSSNQQNLYINIFDTISTIFGLQYISNTAKLMLSGDQKNKIENQEEYKKALSPEIKQGVEINRERYAKKILNRVEQSIKEYTIKDVHRDILLYDKQCDERYGLIEINRALKAMQQNLYNQNSVKKKIDIEAVKKSVEVVTKKVKEKEKKKEEEKRVIEKDNNRSINS